jgi:hypothetical protein
MAPDVQSLPAETALVHVRHASADPGSPLHPDHPGHRLKPYLDRHRPTLSVPTTGHLLSLLGTP